jgi:predicted nucleic acid-binding protein
MPTVANRRLRGTKAAADGPAVRYAETSAVLAALLEGDARAKRALRRRAGALVTSALTFAEAQRALVRARTAGALQAAEERAALRALARLQARCTVLAVSEDVLAAAGRPFPVEPVRTLDAIHLASLAAVSDAPQLTLVISRDHRVCANAEALGYAVDR